MVLLGVMVWIVMKIVKESYHSINLSKFKQSFKLIKLYNNALL